MRLRVARRRSAQYCVSQRADNRGNRETARKPNTHKMSGVQAHLLSLGTGIHISAFCYFSLQSKSSILREVSLGSGGITNNDNRPGGMCLLYDCILYEFAMSCTNKTLCSSIIVASCARGGRCADHVCDGLLHRW